MKQLNTGQFYGQTSKIINMKGITLTDTIYTQDRVDWHYHENAYFTFILQGNITEGNKKEIYNCPANSLIFHYWQDPHYNIKPRGFTQGFHIELEHEWFEKYHFNIKNICGSFLIINPDIKLLLFKIYSESKIQDEVSSVAIHELIMQILSMMIDFRETALRTKPAWVSKIIEILNDIASKNLSIEKISSSLNIHPVHLSRDFSKYFHCNLGEYIRKLKIEKSLSLLLNKNLSLTEIAYECGFSDQSHFTRCFKNINGINPSHYRKILMG